MSLTGTSGAFAAPPASAQPVFGANVRIFDPSMPTAQIQAEVVAIRDQQINDEMGDGPLRAAFQARKVTAASNIRCRPSTGCFTLDNFWRSMSNLTINVTGGDGCRSSANFWAASQASPVRRVNITGGNLSPMDYCTDGPQYASGGFVADSKLGNVITGTQQQCIVRDSTVGSWSNGVWNQVFSGVTGAPAECFPAITDSCGPYTTLAMTPVSREKPYLYIDANGAYNVFVPDAARGSAGVSWQNGATPGRSIPLAKFFVAKPGDSVKTINQQLDRGQNLLFTRAVYAVDKTIEVERANAVVLGMGLATLTAIQGAVVMAVDDVPGVDLAGITIDAGIKNSPVLLQIGAEKKAKKTNSSPSNPTALQDVFFRIGGPNVGKADVSLRVNSDNVVLDDIWAWRADHGNAGTVGWTINTANTGVVVNGDNVTATGLFVEHYQQHNVVWNGNGGKIVFFQNELAYDAPSQAAWMQAPGVNGWSALKVAANAFEVPATLAPGSLHNMLTVFLDPAKGRGGISKVINGIGGASTIPNAGIPVTVFDFPAAA